MHPTLDIDSPQAKKTKKTGPTPYHDNAPAPHYRSLEALWNVRRKSVLTAAEKLVLYTLISHANAKGECWPSTATISDETRLNKKTVRKAVKVLEQRDGPIRIVVTRNRVDDHGDADSHLYTLSPGPGWTETFEIGGSSKTKLWDGRGWVNPGPTPHAESPGGGVIQALPVGYFEPYGRVIQTPKEDTKKKEEEEKEERDPAGSLCPDLSNGKGEGEATKVKVDPVEAVFNLWRDLHGKPDAKLTPARRKLITDRAGDGFKPGQLAQAIRGAKKDPWLMGIEKRSPRKFDGLETILKDAAQVERLIDLDAGNAPKSSAPYQRYSDVAPPPAELEWQAKKRAFREACEAKAALPYIEIN